MCVSDLKVRVFFAAVFAARWCSAERRKHRLKINVTASFNKLLRVHRKIDVTASCKELRCDGRMPFIGRGVE